MKPFLNAGKGGLFFPSSKGGLLTRMMKERKDVLVEITRFRIKI